MVGAGGAIVRGGGLHSHVLQLFSSNTYPCSHCAQNGQHGGRMPQVGHGFSQYLPE